MPHDLKYVYSYIKPPVFMNPPPDSFVVIDSRGPIGIGRFDYLPWHKKETDDLLSEFGLRGNITYGEVPDYGDRKRKRIGNFEHAEIIERKAEGGKRSSMGKIGEDLNRSSQTVMDHIHAHNDDIDKRKYCLRCRRISHPLDTQKV